MSFFVFRCLSIIENERSYIFERKPRSEEDPAKEFQVFYGRGHGALFHILQIAYYQALARVGGDEIKAIEARRWVYFYEQNKVLRKYANSNLQRVSKKAIQGDVRFGFLRNVDIVLSHKGKEQWIELKSYKAKSKGDRILTAFYEKSLMPWSLLGKGNNMGEKETTWGKVYISNFPKIGQRRMLALLGKKERIDLQNWKKFR